MRVHYSEKEDHIISLASDNKYYDYSKQLFMVASV